MAASVILVTPDARECLNKVCCFRLLLRLQVGAQSQGFAWPSTIGYRPQPLAAHTICTSLSERDVAQNWGKRLRGRERSRVPRWESIHASWACRNSHRFESLPIRSQPGHLVDQPAKLPDCHGR